MASLDYRIDHDLKIIRHTRRNMAWRVRPRELDLLAYLHERPGKVITPAQLLSDIWGTENYTIENVRVAVAGLRHKVASDIIVTVFSYGYGVGVEDAAWSEISRLFGVRVN